MRVKITRYRYQLRAVNAAIFFAYTNFGEVCLIQNSLRDVVRIHAVSRVGL